MIRIVFAPAIRRGHRAGVRAAADTKCTLAKRLLAQLANVELPAGLAHAGGARIADVAIISPDDGLGTLTAVLVKIRTSVSNMCVSRRFQDHLSCP